MYVDVKIGQNNYQYQWYDYAMYQGMKSYKRKRTASP